MKKTATVTWIKYNNFGTYLQAYALQQVIRREGYDNDILDDSLIIEEGVQNERFLLFRRQLGEWKCFVTNRKYSCLKKKSERAYQDFQRKYLKINTRILPLEKLDSQYDMFICGSDQIWFPHINIYSPYYYLDFTQKKKIAYAPSVGVCDYPKEFVLKTRPLLERFDYLSAREEQGAQLLASFLEKPICTVLDPTLLLEGEVWKRFVKEGVQEKEKYVLCYFLTPNVWYLNYVKEFANRFHLPLKIFCTHPSYVAWEGCIAAGPEEFLNYIYHSEYFFTDSFHGSIFSILFEKRFCTFKRFTDSSKENQNSRILHLFNLLGLSKYFVGESDAGRIEGLGQIDYSSVKEKLSTHRKQSLDYLVNALKN
ncbi:polysaccharide pyruvyl transferase family protein [Odoribacter lunatus]|uniref:polysaccharide pyruvyl transferase family protein n=1 Tax=Odoribacter lunatus TaxID=2941335 RepID=UPI0020417B6A|nr:polysaccharide pyruvyl transferase family protein [Odoribacter lunatus]